MVQIKSLFLFLFLFQFSFAQKSDFKHINFKKADSIAEVYLGEKLTNLPLLAYNLTHPLSTDVEKFRSIYLWVAQNIKCNLEDAEKNLYMRRKYIDNPVKLRKWDVSMSKKTFKSLFKDKETLCTGYAYLVRELSVLSGLDCEIVDGYSKSSNLNLRKGIIPNHSWNAVLLNEKWYLCDPTWSSGYSLSTKNSSLFIFDYEDGYFLSDPSIFIQNHYPEDLKWSLHNEEFSLEDYVSAPLVYKWAYKHKLIPVLPKKMFLNAKVDQSIEFNLKYLGHVNIEKINLIISKGFNFKKLNPKILLQDHLAIFSTKFNKKGKYDVQVRVGKDVICSYVVKVK